VSGLGRIVRTTAFKLSLAYLAVFAAASVFLIVYIASSTSDLLSRQLEETIDAEIKGLAEQYKSGGLTRLIRVVDARSRAPGASLYLLTDFAGNRIAGNVADAPAALLDAKDGVAQPVPYQRLASDVSDEPAAAKQHQALVRVFVLPAGFRLLVGRDLAERDQFRRVIREAFQVSVGVVILLGLASWIFVTRRVLKRIDAVSETTKTIIAGDLSGRIAVDGSGDEFDRLAISVNAMLDRIEQLMRGLKEVSDNIAHDLKTPLTRLRSRLEVALNGPAAGYRDTLEATIEESDALIRTFEALLRIARVEAGSTGVALTRVDAVEIASEAAEFYEPVAEEAGARILLEARGTQTILGDRNLLSQALANLIDNALKYGRPTLPGAEPVVRIAVERRGDSVVLSVADNGPGVPAAERGRVLERFVRLETSRSEPGSGLGLSLVQAVATLHKGSLTLGDAGPGLVVAMAIPAAAPVDA
jgi:signal transduction histidine kinase